MRPQAPHIADLDGLRGLLALAVAIMHLTIPVPLFQQWVGQSTGLMGHPWWPVDVFFALSGFVMMHVYGAAFSRGIEGRELRAFAVARIARLYPLHLATLVVLLPFPALAILRGDLQSVIDPQGWFSWVLLVQNLLMLHGPWAGHLGWNFPSWSISVEMHLYALFPIVCLALAAVRRPWMIAAILGLGALVGLGAYLAFGEDPGYGPLALLRGIGFFVSGMVAWRIWAQLPAAARLPWRAITLAAFAAIVVIVHMDAPWVSLAVLPVPVLVLGVAMLAREGGTVLASRPAMWLGERSYTIYLVHMPIYMYAQAVLAMGFGLRTAEFGPLMAIAFVGATLVATLVVSAIVYPLFEAPARRWLRRRLEPAPQLRTA